MSLWHNPRWLNRLALIVLTLCAFASLAVAGWWLIQRPDFAIDRVQIEAAAGYELRHVSSQSLRATSQVSSGSNFFTIDLDRVRSQYETVPWVRRAAIRRVWPNQLVVAIEEHQPMAIWGDARLVNTFGEIYSASITQAEADGPLPVLRGPDGQCLGGNF